MSCLADNAFVKEEDSSDDFFQSKHINKRKEKFIKRNNRIILKLERGFKRSSTEYKSKRWSNEKERQFLELFSKMSVDSNTVRSDSICECYLYITLDDVVVCHFDIVNKIISLDCHYVWFKFEKKNNMNYYEVQAFMNEMFKKHFKLVNVIITAGSELYL